MPRIMFVTNDSWFFVSHRLPIAEHAIRDGFEVHVVAREDDTSKTITNTGCEFHAWSVSPRGKSIGSELRGLRHLASLIRKTKPDIVHLITIKPVLYGGLLCRMLGVPSVVYAVSGLGTVFVGEKGMLPGLRFAIKQVYKRAIKHKNAIVIFQNKDDKNLLLNSLNLSSLRTQIIRGSGVDLKKYVASKEPEEPHVVLMPARLLRDKGIFEFASASRILAEKGMQIRFLLAGGNVAVGNPAALNEHEYDTLKNVPGLELLGNREDIAELMSGCHVVVLPSYREGLPKALLEAAASARAVITTDVPGCRDAIEPNITGLLVPVQNSEALADAIQKLIDASRQPI